MLFKNLLSLALASVSSTLLSLSLNYYTSLLTLNYHYSLLFLLAVFFGLNLLNAIKVGSQNYTQLLLAGIVVKLLLAFTFVFVYSFYKEKDFFGFSLHFVCHYVLFTVFEIRYLLSLTKLKSINNEK